MKSGGASNPACWKIANVLLDIHAGWRCEYANQFSCFCCSFSLSYFIFSIVFTGDCLFRIRFSLLLAL